MNDQTIVRVPAALDSIRRETERIEFKMASEPKTGSLLRTLAASKIGGQFLELGTGTGVGTAWLLAGMDGGARLDSVDSDPTVLDVARRHLGGDRRVTFHLADGAVFMRQSPPGQFDLIYADAWPGKFTHLDLALSLLRVGGIYVVDDLLPQPSWPEDHAPKVPALGIGIDGCGPGELRQAHAFARCSARAVSIPARSGTADQPSPSTDSEAAQVAAAAASQGSPPRW